MSSTGPDPESFRLIDLAEIVAQRGRRLVVLMLVVGGGAVAVSFALPAWYRSTATIFGPEEVSESRRVLTTLRSLSIPGVRQNVAAESPETFLAILESRRLREAIIGRFGLIAAFHVRGMEDALRKFQKRTWVDLENTGIIRVTVEDRDRERAAALANAMIEELDRVNVEVRIYKARRARQHLETQLAETRTRLTAAEDSLEQFQRENLAVSIDDQARAAVQAVAELEARAIELRIRRGLVEEYASGSNPEFRAISRELAEVEAQLTRSEVGSGQQAAAENGDPGWLPGETPFAELPGLGVRLGRLLREVKVGETLLALLTEDYEEARLTEAKETPVVQVLDRAVPAERRARPKRSILVVSAMGIALVVSAAYAVAAARYEALTPAADRRRWSVVFDGVRRWFRSGARET